MDEFDTGDGNRALRNRFIQALTNEILSIGDLPIRLLVFWDRMLVRSRADVAKDFPRRPMRSLIAVERDLCGSRPDS